MFGFISKFFANWAGSLPVDGGWPSLEKVGRIFNCKVVQDAWLRPVLLFKNDWNLNQLNEDYPDLKLSSVAPVVSGIDPVSL